MDWILRYMYIKTIFTFFLLCYVDNLVYENSTFIKSSMIEYESDKYMFSFSASGII